MATGKVRIFELAKELGMSSKELIALFERLGLEAKNQLSVVDDQIAGLLRAQLGKSAAPAAPKAAPQASSPPPAAVAEPAASAQPRPAKPAPPEEPIPVLKPVTGRPRPNASSRDPHRKRRRHPLLNRKRLNRRRRPLGRRHLRRHGLHPRRRDPPPRLPPSSRSQRCVRSRRAGRASSRRNLPLRKRPPRPFRASRAGYRVARG